MPHPAAKSISRSFHKDICTIRDATIPGAKTWDQAAMSYTLTEKSIIYRGACALDERSGVRYSDEQPGRLMIQGAEIRILNAPSTIAVGQTLSIDRLPDREWEIREISAGTGELTTTLLVQSISQIPAREQ